VIDAGEYGLYPVCSKNGALKGNYAQGCLDSGIYVGKSFGCTIAYNIAVG
jgi:parallel beta-helix repeat protein